MSNMQFTPAQEDAIHAEGGSVIVSAAAGSGKTRVLVERVIRKLTDPEHPVDADRMLIVTFTRAAAEEMRSRIAAAIEEQLMLQPDNLALRRQQLLLPNADISTIHSFCSRIIRENFFALDIKQDFRMASEGEAAVWKNRILSELLEEYCTQKPPEFLLLRRILSEARSDKRMEKALLTVYESSKSHPFPDEWLEEVTSFYDPDVPIEKTIYGAAAYEILDEAVENIRYELQTAAEVINANPSFTTSAVSCGRNKLEYLEGFLERLEEASAQNDWKRLHDCMTSFEKAPYRKPTGKKNTATDEECLLVKHSFERVDALVTEKLVLFFGIDPETYRQDTQTVYPAVRCLCELLQEFDRRYFEAKKERGVLDFSDLEHLLLHLLVEEGDQGRQKTPLARTLSAQYDEIMVDEYQDTNDTQETIFRYLSRDDSNLFTVGDVKQSIYRFREAKPELFKNRRAGSLLYDRNAPAFPARIILDRNFRSREGIIDSINFVFHTLMSEHVGDIVYNEEEKLTAGLPYPPATEPETELHLLSFSKSSDDTSDEEEEADTYEKEAVYIASLIKQMIQSGKTVTDHGTQRPVRYGDFAVLMRYLSTNGQTYVDVLNRHGIPACIDKPYNLFECYEVNLALSLLKIIDNPLQDIPLLAVLLCPVFGFTPDELSELKADYFQKLLYHRIVACSLNEKAKETPLGRKCAAFTKLLFELRKISVTLSISKLLSYVYARTGFLPIISAMENGEIRRKNLKKLSAFIGDYEQSGRRSLTDLIRHINYLEENGSDIRIGDTAPADAVRVMSIHHSKGLEFPVCILASLSSKGSSDTDEIMCHDSFGLGFKTVDADSNMKFNTLQRNVIAYCKEQEEQSEAMRVLYVALTRAREKLIALVSVNSRSENGLEKKLTALASTIRTEEERLSPYCVDQYRKLSDWFLLCALVHPDMQALRQETPLSIPILPTASRWKYVKVEGLPKDEENGSSAISEPPPLTDAAMTDFFEQRFSRVYRYQRRTEIPAKVAASMLVHSHLQLEHVASSRPAFLQEKNMTGAERGTAMHQLLQYASLSALSEEPKQEVERLVRDGFLTPEQGNAVNLRDVAAFTNSNLYRHMTGAEKLLREYRFTVTIQASDADDTYPEDESIILQGAIDCLLINSDGMIVIDYKTDRVQTVQELARRYERQLTLYRKAAEQLFDLPVRKCVIYSVHLGQEIEIPT